MKRSASGWVAVGLVCGTCAFVLFYFVGGSHITTGVAIGVAVALGSAGLGVAPRPKSTPWLAAALLAAGSSVALTLAATWQLPDLAVREMDVQIREAKVKDAEWAQLNVERAKAKEEARRTTLTAAAGVVAFLSWFTTWYLKRDELEHERLAKALDVIGDALERFKDGSESAQLGGVAHLRSALHSGIEAVRAGAEAQLQAICAGYVPALPATQWAAAHAIAGGPRDNPALRHHIGSLEIAEGVVRSVTLSDVTIGRLNIPKLQVYELSLTEVEVGTFVIWEIKPERSVILTRVLAREAILLGIEGSVQLKQCRIESGTLGIARGSVSAHSCFLQLELHPPQNEDPEFGVSLSECGLALQMLEWRRKPGDTSGWLRGEGSVGVVTAFWPDAVAETSIITRSTNADEAREFAKAKGSV